MTDRSEAASETTPAGRRLRHRRRSATFLAAAGLTAAGSFAVGTLAVGGVAGASAAGSSHAPRSVTAATHHPRGRRPLLEHLLRGTLHADFVVRTKSGATETFVFDRGVVSSVTSTNIQIVPADTTNGTVSAAITSKTRFRGIPDNQLKSGDKVALLVQGGDAVIVGSRPPTRGTATLPPARSTTAGASTGGSTGGSTTAS